MTSDMAPGNRQDVLVSDRDLFIGYRIRVIYIGLLVSWLAVIAYAVAASRSDGPDDGQLLINVLLLAGGVALLTVTPWRSVLATRFGDPLILVWCTLGVVGLLLGDELRSDEPIVAAFLSVIIFAGALLVSPVTLTFIGAIAASGYLIALDRSPVTLTTGQVAARLLAFLLAMGFTLITARGISRELRVTRQQLDALDDESQAIEQRRQELDQLYAVSRTIGMGSKLAEVLPELVGRVVTAVNAKIGLVFLYRPDQEALDLISPVWVAGHTLKAEGYTLPLTDPGSVQRVFTSGEPLVRNDLVHAGPADALLTDLDTTRVAAVPLRIEARPIGVLMVADKATGNFNQDDIESLESLAGPSALVLNQMSRYEEAQETGEKMAELAQLKTDFVSVVSHELRTPLTSIIGSLKTLQRPELAPPSESARDLIGTAERQANRLRTLIEDLLVVSRLDNQALPVRPVALDLATFLKEVISDIPATTGRVNLEPLTEQITLEADPDHLRRIVTNLVENAIKYSQDSPIEVAVRSKHVEVWISVIDHGHGIPYELHDLIFQRFTQVERHETRGAGGTGLGLSIVRGLSEAMGGRVWFEPTVGGGATFTVAMPRLSAARPT